MIKRADHATAIITLALGMLRALREEDAAGNPEIAMRIGIASGPAIGGVIGQKRILFDLWGETVNIASRMESAGIPGRIHVASSTRELVGDGYAFEERRSVDIKGLGPMTTYLLVD